MTKLCRTLVALVGLGGVALADDVIRPGTSIDIGLARRSNRGVARDYLVRPRGGELSAQMRFVTADAMLEGDRLQFTDLALFGLSGRWSLFSRLELGASVDLLPKQPPHTDEKPWQSVGVALRSPLGKRVAVQLSAGGGHLMSHSGKWVREGLAIEWKKPVHDEFLAFSIQGGVSGLGLDAPNTTSKAFVTEVGLTTTALFREPSGHWGAWLGIAYSIPVQSSGRDPTTELPIDPQPRLDLHVGTVLAIVPKWDLYVDLAILDRGDLARRATTLPILQGGFDQKQIIFGVTRHFDGTPRAPDDDDDPALRLSSL